MTDIHIPAEALEAAARALYKTWFDKENDPSWENAPPNYRQLYLNGATAALRAALANWPGMGIMVTEDYIGTRRQIILPLTENSNDKG